MKYNCVMSIIECNYSINACSYKIQNDWLVVTRVAHVFSLCEGARSGHILL